MLVCFVSTLVVCCLRLLVLAATLTERATEDWAAALMAEALAAEAEADCLAVLLAVSFSLRRASCRP